MPKNTKVNNNTSKTKPVKKPKIHHTIKKKSKTKDLEREIRAKNLKRGIIEVLEMSRDESSYGIKPNNPQIVSSTPIKTSAQTIPKPMLPLESSQTGSPDSTKTENTPTQVESGDKIPLPLKELDNLLHQAISPISIIVTPPTPEKTNKSAHTPENNSVFLVPPNAPFETSKTKCPPPKCKTIKFQGIPAPNVANKSLTIPSYNTSPNQTPKLPKLRIRKIINCNTAAYRLIKPTELNANDKDDYSFNHHGEPQHSLNSSQLSLPQIENLNRTLQTRIAKLIEEKSSLENQLDLLRDKHKREISKQEWKLKQAQLEIRMLKINIQEKEGKIKNQEAIILSSYTGYEPDKNKPNKIGERTHRDLLRDNKRLENMLSATRKQMEEETNRKEMFKKEMLRTKRDLSETLNRIKDAADDETKKIIDDLTKTCNTLTTDLDLATQKINDLKNHNKELADRIKEVSKSNSIAQSDIRASAPYPIDPNSSDIDELFDTRSVAEITVDDDVRTERESAEFNLETCWFFNTHMDHQGMDRNLQMINRHTPDQQHSNPQRYTNRKDIVCKYYMQNRCRFGHRCFYKHPTSAPRNRTRIPDLMSINVQRPAPWHNPNAPPPALNLANIYPNLSSSQFPPLYQSQESNPNQQIANYQNNQSYSQTIQQQPTLDKELSILANLSHNLNQPNFPINLANSTHFHPLLTQCS